VTQTAIVPVSDVTLPSLLHPLPIDQNPVLVYLGRLTSANSRRAMHTALRRVVQVILPDSAWTDLPDPASLDWSSIRYQHAAAVRARLSERYRSAAAVNQSLVALRGVLKEAWRLGLIDSETFARATDLQSIREERLPSGRALSAGEVRALFKVCAADRGPAGVRDAALLAVLYGAGLRRSEAVALDLADYDPETGALVIRGGKGRKDRTAYATNGGKDALDDWLAIRGVEPGPLLVAVRKGGTLEHRHLTPQAVRDAVHKRAEQARVEAFSPHDLRRSFISELLDAGADIVTVQKLAGHARPETTARYDRRGEQVKRKAAELLHVPYRRQINRTGLED
jgi:site-specific recombinase XerD